jgi:hypothetical protein
MTATIPAAYVEQFTANCIHQAQQMGSRLRRVFNVETGIVGESWTVEDLGATEAEQITSRHADTPLIDQPHRRRRGYLEDWAWAAMLDPQDDVRTLISPLSKYVKAGGYAMGRQIDRIFIEQATATVVSGKDGGSTISFPSGQQVALDFVEEGAATDSGLTIPKLRRVLHIFGVNEADAEMPDGSPWITAVVSQKQLTDLLKEDEVINGDYSEAKHLVSGKIKNFMGMRFVKTQLLSRNTTTDARTCLFFAGPDAMRLGVGADVKGRISERADKNYNRQAYFSMHLGAVRVQEDRVVSALCADDGT